MTIAISFSVFVSSQVFFTHIHVFITYELLISRFNNHHQYSLSIPGQVFSHIYMYTYSIHVFYIVHIVYINRMLLERFSLLFFYLGNNRAGIQSAVYRPLLPLE